MIRAPPAASGSGRDEPVTVDRRRYAARQAQLLDALMSGTGYPPGFVVADAEAAGKALRRKRARAVRAAWPALVFALGDRFEPAFDAFARTTALPAVHHAIADGLAFASALRADDRRADGVRVELLLARALVRRSGRTGDWRPRRGIVAGAARLRDPHRLLIVGRLPRLGRRRVTVRLPARR